MAHLADQDLGQILGFQRGGAGQQAAQQVELARPRMAALDGGDLAQLAVHFRNRELGGRLVGPQPHHDFDRIAEIDRLRKDILAAIQRLGYLRGDAPHRPPAEVELGLIADRQRPANHEAGGGLGLLEIERGEEIARQLRHLEAALGLAERLADLGELKEAGHVV